MLLGAPLNGSYGLFGGLRGYFTPKGKLEEEQIQEEPDLLKELAWTSKR
jgi:hypothetical protein